MRILCDLDDVLWELVPKWTSWLYMIHDVRVDPNDIVSWHMPDYYPTLTKEQVYEPLFHKNFFDNMKPVDGAAETIQKLKDDGHEFLVVTATHHKTTARKVEELLRLFPMINRQDVITTYHKNLINGDVLIDDSVDNIESFPWFSILFTRPHNANHEFSRPQNQFRCDDWAQVYERISEIDKRMREVML